jgi:translation initiation factor 1
MPKDNSRLVYSTDKTAIGMQKPAGRDLPATSGASKSGTIVRLDRKGRSGKSVTVIEGLQLSAQESEKLLKQFKAKLGTGGTVKDGSLEIQGDHCDAVITELARIGYKPKRSGG